MKSYLVKYVFVNYNDVCYDREFTLILSDDDNPWDSNDVKHLLNSHEIYNVEIFETPKQIFPR